MATPGTPWIKEKTIIVEALKKNKGKLTHAAKQLKVCYETLKKKIDSDPELIQLLSDLRNDFENTLLDEAEDCILFAMGKKDTDLSNATRSAFFVLNSKGKARGWTNTISEANKETVVEAVLEIEQRNRNRIVSESRLENQKPLCDQRSEGQQDSIPS